MFGIQPETEICVLSWGYKLTNLKVQLPVLFKTHDHVTENGDSQFGITSLRVRISISWRNTLGKQMRKVQWNKQCSRDGACFHPPEQAHRPEPWGQGLALQEFYGVFSALALTNFPTGCCPQNSFERQFWGFWWFTGNWYTDNHINFPTPKCYFSFYELCASTVQLCTGNKES